MKKKRNIIRENKFKITTIVTFIIFITLLPFFFHSFVLPIEFNQFLIQKLEIQYGVISAEDFADMITSSYSSGLNIIFNNPITEKPDFNDPEAVFSYIFSWIPPHAIVYPTEGFYYLSTNLKNAEISGNVRVADLDKGKLNLAYFTVNETGRRTEGREFTVEDGLGITKISEGVHEVTYKGKTVHFKIAGIENEPPKKLQLLPEEEFVGHIHDEAGIKFFLMYNHQTNSFYDVLDEESGLADFLEEIDEHHVIGKRTGFMYYHDKEYDRKILVGVFLPNIAANNYLDGPGDQVPFWPNLREKLHIAYPNTMLGDGIDEHGVYLNRSEWARIAITPFLRFDDQSYVIEKTSMCTSEAGKSAFWTCLTKEWWNTPSWRQGIFEQLANESKTINNTILCDSIKDYPLIYEKLCEVNN